MMGFDTRVGAYGLIIEEDSILLVHFNALGTSHWTLPGGGLELGEDGEAAAVREIKEETGYHVALVGLLGVDSVQILPGDRLDGRKKHLHSLRLIYEARTIDGELKREDGGSTDDAAWFRLEDVPELERSSLVEVGIDLWQSAGIGTQPLSPAS